MSDTAKTYPQIKNLRILVVDNNMAVQQQIADHLLQTGFQVLISRNTDDAKEIIKNENIDLLITEMQLPNESGIELIRWVRRIYDTSFRKYMPLPCLMMTGFSHILEKEDLSDLHLSDCLLKPVENSELTEAILIALELKEPEPEEVDEVEEIKANFVPHERQYCKIFTIRHAFKTHTEHGYFCTTFLTKVCSNCQKRRKGQ